MWKTNQAIDKNLAGQTRFGYFRATIYPKTNISGSAIILFGQNSTP